MNDFIKPSTKIHTIDDAIKLSKRRLPKLVFDFIDGASGDDKLAEINSAALDQIRLEPKVFRNVENRKLNKKIFDLNFDYPFGFAPMGMTNLSWPEADKMIAKESAYNNIPTCVSMASSTTLEDMFTFSEGHSWMQIYIFQSEEFIMELLKRAENIGYKVLILTVDVPILSRRARDDRNGFGYPFKIGPKQFLDFALHPHWSLTTLLKGPPKPMNYVTSKSGDQIFRRKESRGATDWNTLKRVRDAWKGKLIIKGVMNSEDALKIKEAGADAIQVSNHGGRQLDSATASINALPLIRKSLGDDFPILFDSGIRSGSDILRALALGADFVMFGRPLMYAIGADGSRGLRRIINLIKEELSTNLGLVGLTDINEVDKKIIAEKFFKDIKY
ncbi:alpha-hydroxy-acid oxidizing protein [Pelagibacteraceae bacterium]|nr:alpha-hydroxy-acid oxidizing protein [Pelagibacteraceae bacterium]